MKKILIVLLLSCIYFLGCNSNRVVNKSLEDSLKTAPKYTKYTDSFINVEQDKIMGNLKFGMSKKDAEREIEKFNQMHKQERENGRGYRLLIGKFEYNRIDAKYDNDKLFEISFVGEGNQSLYGLENGMDDLIKLLAQKYGEPFPESDTSIKSDDNKAILWKDRKRWVIGRKNIAITLYIIDNYKNDALEIYLPDIDDKFRKKEKYQKDSIANVQKNIF